MSDDSQNQPDPEEMAHYRDRSVAYYGALVTAWIETRMERDKQILTLSSLGLGGLIALEQTGLNDVWSFGFWIAAGLVFIVTILLALVILSLNAKHISALVRDTTSTDHERCLLFLDIVLMMFFFIGIVLTFTLAVHESGFTITKNGGTTP